MVWVAFSIKGVSDNHFIDGKLYSNMYTYILSDLLLPFAHYHYGEKYEFQNDNCFSPQKQ